MSVEISVIVIFISILLLFYINEIIFIKYSNTSLGKLFAIIYIILCTYVHIGIGICILILTILYYKIYDNVNNINYLDGIECIYWINLNRSIDRKQKMEEMFTDPIFLGKPILITSIGGLILGFLCQKIWEGKSPKKYNSRQ
jgi:hypothetical protein